MRKQRAKVRPRGAAPCKHAIGEPTVCPAPFCPYHGHRSIIQVTPADDLCPLMTPRRPIILGADSGRGTTSPRLLKFTAKTADEGELLIYGDIGEYYGPDAITAKEVDRLLKGFTGGFLTVRINSPGGEVFEGLAILSMLKRLSARVTTLVDGLAASAASLVFMGGSRRVMPRNTQLMIHAPMMGAFGNSTEMEKAARTLRAVTEPMIAAYTETTGLPRAVIEKMLEEETWISADDAVSKRFATEIEETVVQASRQGSVWNVNGMSMNLAGMAQPVALLADDARAVDKGREERAARIMRAEQEGAAIAHQPPQPKTAQKPPTPKQAMRTREERAAQIAEYERRAGVVRPTAPVGIGQIALMMRSPQRAEMHVDPGASGGFLLSREYSEALTKFDYYTDVMRPGATIIAADTGPSDLPIDLPFFQNDGSGNLGGAAVVWFDDGVDLMAEALPTMTNATLIPKGLGAYVVVTDRLLRSGRSVDTVLAYLLREAIAKAADAAYLTGNGIGQPMGVLNAPGTLRIARAAAGTISAADIVNMKAALYPRSHGRAVWVTSNTTLATLEGLLDAVNNPVGLTGGSTSRETPYQLGGIPVRITEALPDIGNPGDLMLIDRRHYLIKDGEGVRLDASSCGATNFIRNKTTVRATIHTDGQPINPQPITLSNGSVVSPFVVLQ